MTDDFDPEFDKLPDQPVTIGGDKSAAAWHPNSGPEVPHADLITRLRGMARNEVARDPMGALTEAADALAALGDTVPREQFDGLMHTRRATEQARDDFQRECGEARAERDALYAKIKLAHYACDRCEGSGWINPTIDDAMPCDAPLHDVLATAPTVSLALHDAQVKAQALDEAAEVIDKRDEDVAWVHRWLTVRAAAIREQAK